jgi:hypothetical protein
MTQPLSNLSTRLVDFEHQIRHLKDEAKTIASSDTYPPEKFNATKHDYFLLNTDRKSLKKEVDSIIKTVEKPFRTAISQMFDSLNRSYKKLNEKLDRSYTSYTISFAIRHTCSELFSYHLPSLLQEDDGMEKMDELKTRNLQLISRPGLTASQLEKAVQFRNSIENHQKKTVNAQLKELYHLIEASINEPKTTNHFDRMNNIFNSLLPSCALGRKVQGQISNQVKYSSVSSVTGFISNPFKNSKDNPVFNDLPKLSKILSTHSLFKLTDDPETLDEDSAFAQVYRGAIPVFSEPEQPQEEVIFLEEKVQTPSLEGFVFVEPDLGPEENLTSEATQPQEEIISPEEELYVVEEEAPFPAFSSTKEPETIQSQEGVIFPIEELYVVKREALTPAFSYIGETEAIQSEETVISSEEKNVENEAPIEIPSADPKKGEMDLVSLGAEIMNLQARTDLSESALIQLINYARSCLPVEVRCALDGTFYRLSTVPDKGGDGWADKHSAEDPELLLEAIRQELEAIEEKSNK